MDDTRGADQMKPRHALTDGRGVRHLALASVLVFTCAAGVRLTTPPLAPRVNLRWAPGVSDGMRIDLERQFQLVAGRRLDGPTWAYDLADPSPAVVGALIRHPAVADTHEIDRALGVVSVAAPRGATRLGRHVLGAWVESRPVEWFAEWSLWSALISAVWLASSRRAPAQRTPQEHSATPETSPQTLHPTGPPR